jgi:hypothetical protein
MSELRPSWVAVTSGGAGASQLDARSGIQSAWPRSCAARVASRNTSERFVSVQAAAPSSVYCIVGGVAFIISFGLGATAAVLVRRP